MGNSMIDKYRLIGQQVPSTETLARYTASDFDWDITPERNEPIRRMTSSELRQFEIEDLQFSKELTEASRIAATL